MPRILGLWPVLGLVLALAAPRPAAALPIFAHQYGVTCRKCHTVIPHLTAFGAAFLANGNRIAGVTPGPAIPFAVKVNLVDSSANQGRGPSGAGLPKAIVDEVELFSAGALGSRGSFLVEDYAVDGAEPGKIRDLWIADNLTPWGSRIPIQVQAGSFTAPLPVDPETFRETYQDYAPFVQTAGTNPFDFKAPRVGGRLGIGDALRGPSLQFFAGPGHDRGSGLATIGNDVMENLSDALGPVTIGVYHYQGQRPSLAGTIDNFNRTGYALTYDAFSRWSSQTVLQNGWDSACGLAIARGCSTSGGFTQLRYAFNRRFFAEGRYEGTFDSTAGLARDGVVLLGYAPLENIRATAEDAIAHSPQTANTMNVQLTVAY